jgi:hypothetical protein
LQRATVDFQERWIAMHIKAAEALGKPLVLEEFGKEGQGRDRDNTKRPFFSAVYNNLIRSINGGSALRGGRC